MKRYIVFSGETYYPNPGWIGFVGDYNSTEEIDLTGFREYDWWQVVDLETGQIVDGAGYAFSQGYVKAFPNGKDEE